MYQPRSQTAHSVYLLEELGMEVLVKGLELDIAGLGVAHHMAVGVLADARSAKCFQAGF